jgi:hypothetical protein
MELCTKEIQSVDVYEFIIGNAGYTQAGICLYHGRDNNYHLYFNHTISNIPAHVCM